MLLAGLAGFYMFLNQYFNRQTETFYPALEVALFLVPPLLWFRWRRGERSISVTTTSKRFTRIPIRRAVLRLLKNPAEKLTVRFTVEDEPGPGASALLRACRYRSLRIRSPRRTPR